MKDNSLHPDLIKKLEKNWRVILASWWSKPRHRSRYNIAQTGMNSDIMNIAKEYMNKI